jgi:hypothetical protein
MPVSLVVHVRAEDDVLDDAGVAYMYMPDAEQVEHVRVAYMYMRDVELAGDAEYAELVGNAEHVALAADIEHVGLVRNAGSDYGQG